MKTRQAVAAVTLAAAACGAGAQTMKPGLWEIDSRMQTGSGPVEQNMAQLQQQMAGMPPEQLRKMQEMMAKQGVGSGSAGGAAVKICMTKEMVERNHVPAQQGDCRQVVSPRSGNTMKMSFSCANPPASGEGTVTFVSPEAYTMKMTVNTQVQGKTQKMNVDGSGRWLSADCGAVKPIAAPKK